MLLGMRTVKTAVGVVLCLVLSYLLGLGNPLFAVIAFIVVMQNTLSETYEVGKYRIYGTLLGGTLGAIFYVIWPGSLTLSFIGIIAIIVIMNFFEWSRAITIGLIVFISILGGDPPTTSIWTAASIRIIDTIIGILIAFAINFFISPPEYETQLSNQLNKLRNQEWVYLNDLILLDEKPSIKEIFKSIDESNSTASILEKETLPIKWWRKHLSSGLSQTLKNRLFHLSRSFIHLGIIKDLPLCVNLTPENKDALKSLDILLLPRDVSEQNISASNKSVAPEHPFAISQAPHCFSTEEQSTLFNYHLSRLLFHLQQADELAQQWKDIHSKGKSTEKNG